MINTPITHPEILGALAATGHRSKVLVADAHYAAATAVGTRAKVVYLNLEPGSPSITRVVELVSAMVPIELRTCMSNPDADYGGVQEEVTAILGPDVPRQDITREDFYASARSDDLVLCIVTGDTRRFGNVMLTIGVHPRAGS